MKSIRVLYENYSKVNKIMLLEQLREQIDKELESLYGNNGG
jgi:hypothetical protein